VVRVADPRNEDGLIRVVVRRVVAPKMPVPKDAARREEAVVAGRGVARGVGARVERRNRLKFENSGMVEGASRLPFLFQFFSHLYPSKRPQQ
jgi:hypothetical protein